MPLSALPFEVSGAVFSTLIALLLIAAVAGYAFLSRVTVQSRIRKEPDLHIEADPLMQAPLYEPDSDPAPLVQADVSQDTSCDSESEFKPCPHLAASLLGSLNLGPCVVVESGYVNGPLYFSDLEASVQAEIFNLEAKERIYGTQWVPFMYQSEALAADSKLVFIYAHPVGQPNRLSGYCFIG